MLHFFCSRLMQPRCGHSALVFGDNMVVFGGKAGPADLSADVNCLSLSSHVWSRLVCSGTAPKPRAFHSAAAYGYEMIVFGGITAVGVDDIHYNMYNIFCNSDIIEPASDGRPPFKLPRDLQPATQRKLEPSSLFVLDLRGQASWRVVLPTGDVPPTRSHHIASVVGSKMYIFGGYSVHTTAREGDKELQDVYSTFCLDLETWIWRRVNASPGLPKIWGMGAALSGSYWISIGGVDISMCGETSALLIFNFESQQWRMLAVPANEASSAPPPRAMHTLVRWGDRIIIFGGSTSVNTVLNDLCQFDLITGTLEKLQQSGDVPSPRRSHTAVVVGDRLLVFGGVDESGGLRGDLWSLPLRDGTITWTSVSASRGGDVDNIRGWGPGRAPSHVLSTMQSIATQSDSTPADVLALLSSERTINKLRQGRDNLIETNVTRATNDAHHIFDGVPPGVRGAPPSLASSEVAVLRRQYTDARSAPEEARELACQYWRHEIDVLMQESAEWRRASEVESSAVISSFFGSRDEGTSSLTRGYINSGGLPTALSPGRRRFVSPILSKLGLEGSLGQYN